MRRKILKKSAQPSCGKPCFHRPPGLPFVEARSAADSQACYRPHAHTEWSIGTVDAGHSRFSVAGAEYRLGPGDLVLLPPGLVHACNPEERAAWSYRMLYLDAAWMLDFLAGSPAAAALAEQPWRIVGDAVAYHRFSDTFTAVSETTSANHFAGCLSQLLTALAGQPLKTPATASVPAGIAAVRDWLDAHCDETIPLAELAAIAGLSRYQLIRRFVRHTGMTPHAYQLDRRIQHARRLLAAGAPICDTALAVGFADQSHFHRSFRERVAATPGQYGRRR